MSDGGFWDGPGDRAEVVAGRYRIPDPVTGEVRSWTRASNIGAAVADRWALERYNRRQLVRGLAGRVDLLDLLRASVELDNAKCDEVIETALQVAGSTEKANQGTMIHEVQQRVDLGLPIPEGLERYADGYRAGLARAGLTVVAIEVLLCNRPLGAMGRADRIYREADGTLIIGDTKSTAHLDLAQHEIAPQLTVYAHADYVDARGFTGSRYGEGDQPNWMRSQSIRQDYALAVHVDRESGAVSFYRVDLYLGGYGANLATQVREWRNVKGILLPYVPPMPGVPGAGENGARPLTLVPPVVDNAPGDAWEIDGSQKTADLVNALPEVGGAGYEATEQGIPQPDQAVTDEQAYVAESRHESSAAFTMDALMRLGKPELQSVLRGLDPGASVAHQRKILAEKILTLQSGGMVATSTPAAWPRPGKDPAELAGSIGTEDPTDPRSDAFRRARLAEIAAAATVGTLSTINRAVVRRGGDQAWTEEMTEAARARVAVLDAGHDQLRAETHRNKLIDCGTPQEVAELWDLVTVGGSAPDRWTTELHQAAQQRLEQIRQATPPAPANPFANQ